MPKAGNKKRTNLFAQITVDAMRLFGGKAISKLCPAHQGDEVLREIDLAVYLLVLSHSAGGNNDFFASPATLAEILGREIGTVRRAIKRLEQAGIITKIGYRIVHRKTNNGFTVSTAAEGRKAMELGAGLCFSTRVYSVKSPDEYLSHLRLNLIGTEELLGSKKEYDFTMKPEDFGVNLPKNTVKVSLKKIRRILQEKTSPSAEQ